MSQPRVLEYRVSISDRIRKERRKEGISYLLMGAGALLFILGLTRLLMVSL